MAWTEEKCLELISAYEKQEILWNVKHPQHYKLRRYDVWEEVAGRMGVDAETCRRKMTALLASLWREKVKMKKCMSYSAGAAQDVTHIFRTNSGMLSLPWNLPFFDKETCQFVPYFHCCSWEPFRNSLQL
jgi:hypothetical protein